MNLQSVDLVEPLVDTSVFRDQETIGQELLRGLVVVRYEQPTTGEILAYKQVSKGYQERHRSILASTFVYDALGYLDPCFSQSKAQALEMISAQTRRWFAWSVIRVRKQIRAFIAWQEEANATWRLFGRGSGVLPDSATTACAAAVLAETTSSKKLARRKSLDDNLKESRLQRHVKALEKFRSPDGVYYTYVDRNQRGYSWMDEHGRPIEGFDRAVNAHVLRYLALAGQDVTDLTARLLDEILQENFREDSLDCANPMYLFHSLTRAWYQAQLPGLEEVSRILVPHILRLQNQEGDFGSVFNTALALSSLLDLGYTGPAIKRAKKALLSQVQPRGGWSYPDYSIHGFGSPTWITATAMMALARCCDWY